MKNNVLLRLHENILSMSKSGAAHSEGKGNAHDPSEDTGSTATTAAGRKLLD